MRTKKKQGIGFKTVLLLVIICALFALSIAALPTGPTFSGVASSTSNNPNSTLRGSDQGGYIYTLTLDTLQQNYGWKAYVGNLTGKLTLDDSSNYTIFDWSLTDSEAEVYISRDGAVDWTTVNCSNSSGNRNNITAEDSALGKTSTSIDSINQTFSASIHKSFVVAGRTMTQSSCPSIATYVNDTAQSSGVNNLFQEVLLSDSNGNVVYATIAETDDYGYRNGTTYDFQAIIADQDGAPTTSYYFYVELGS
ncbi:hypothetical protein GOV05_03725 [Candidatus Woesearchaeota archaeon]|nr:hypothetical protein [Candidatus Woesearchaeota archaeon]